MKLHFSLFALVFAGTILTTSAEREGIEVPDDFEIEILEVPEDCEKRTIQGHQIYVHYTGKLESGQIFDSSYDREEPFDFLLGAGHVIRGWDLGLTNMCVGEKRKLVVPSELAYGETGAGDKIPPNAKLTFEVELVEIDDQAHSVPDDVFMQIDTNGDLHLDEEEIQAASMEKVEYFFWSDDTETFDDELAADKLTKVWFDLGDIDKDRKISVLEYKVVMPKLANYGLLPFTKQKGFHGFQFDYFGEADGGHRHEL